MIYFIIAAEIAFWVMIFAGLFTRYVMKLKKISLVFLFSTPFIDLALLILTAFDLKNGSEASFAHGIAAIYIGVSISFGKTMIEWADNKFQGLFLKKKIAKNVLYGKEKGIYEMKMWARHLIAYVIGVILLILMILYVENGSFNDVKTLSLIRVLSIWTFVLVIDFIISFSYIIFPKRKFS